MRLERVVLPSPAIGEELSLWCCGEQLSVEELIPESSIERLRKAVLPRGRRLDVGRAGGAAGLTPDAKSLGNELLPVVRSDERWRRVASSPTFSGPARKQAWHWGVSNHLNNKLRRLWKFSQSDGIIKACSGASTACR